MRTKFVQTLADCQLELKGLKTRYEFEKAKPSEEDDDEEEADDEFIDVTGDDSSTEVQQMFDTDGSGNGRSRLALGRRCSVT